MINFNRFPFGLPSSHSDAPTVNMMLRKSYMLQERLRVTNACFFVTSTLQKCLSEIGIDAELVYGTTDAGSYVVPHLWLKIDGHVIDNTFVEDIPEPLFIKLKQLSNYTERRPEENDPSLFFGDEDTRDLGVEDHSVKQFIWLLGNKDKAYTLCVNKIQIFQYYKDMFSFVKSQYGKEVPEFEPCDSNCWNCDIEKPEGGSLKACSKCKIAKYCSKSCQAKDWKKAHKLLCLLPNSY